MINGIINIYKEKGFTSHDVVAKLRGILKQKKIGHTGTLDPDAEGVLPVCLGSGTKLCEQLTDKSKEYQAVLKLGITTDTQDMTGKIVKESKVDFDEEFIRKTILSFEGEYDQIPPMYSALKVNGKKLYELAREGIEIERAKRKVFFYKIDILKMEPDQNQVTISATCSKGTYIRTLCHDIGEKTGWGGCMKSLLRTRSGEFFLKDSLKLSQVEAYLQDGSLLSYITPVEAFFSAYPGFTTSKSMDKLLYNGNMLTASYGAFQWDGLEASNPLNQENDFYVRVYDSNHRFFGVYEYNTEKKHLKPYKMFM